MKTNHFMEKLTPMRLFTTISLIGIVLFVIYSIVFGHISFQWMVMTNETNYYFQDFFKHVLFTADPKNLYETATGVWGCFPPFVYILYFLFYRMTAYYGMTPENWRELIQVDVSVTVFIYYSIFVAIIMFLAIQLWQTKKGSMKLFTCLALSVPFFAGIERGNSIILVFALLLVILKWRDSESPVKSELALILIAICAAIKIYPAIFGIMYIKDRRYKETLRLLVYGILFFSFHSFSSVAFTDSPYGCRISAVR